MQVKIDNAVNAKLMTEPNPQWAMVTIVGINDTPEPRFIANMQMYMGLVCGAATAVPCALLSARLVRSFNRKGVYVCARMRACQHARTLPDFPFSLALTLLSLLLH